MEKSYIKIILLLFLLFLLSIFGNYTVIGDSVNLGARLEGVNKQYGTNIIVSESTYLLVKDKFNFKELETIKVKGKEKPVKIYELLEEKAISSK